MEFVIRPTWMGLNLNTLPTRETRKPLVEAVYSLDTFSNQGGRHCSRRCLVNESLVKYVKQSMKSMHASNRIRKTIEENQTDQNSESWNTVHDTNFAAAHSMGIVSLSWTPMNQHSIVFRAANPVFEEGLAGARYLDQSADGFFQFWLGPRAENIIVKAFLESA